MKLKFLLITVNAIFYIQATFRTPKRSEFSRECDIPLGMTNGAITNADIRSSHPSASGESCSNDVNGLRIGMNKTWCVAKTTETVWFQVDFREITIVQALTIDVGTPITFQLFATNMSVEDTEDFEPYGINTKLNPETFQLDKEEEKISLENFISGRTVRILIKHTKSNDFNIQFELYGCPYWIYAKPLGIAIGTVKDSQITDNSNNSKSKESNDPRNIRLGNPTKGWNPFPGINGKVNENEYWLQVDFEKLKKIVYVRIIQYFDTNYVYSKSYRIMYGKNESAMKFYGFTSDSKLTVEINPPRFTKNNMNSLYVFRYPLILRIFRYFPVCNESLNCAYTKLELYGSHPSTPDIQWKNKTDRATFNDLICNGPCHYDGSKHFLKTSTLEQSNQFQRSPYLQDDDCLLDPEQCDDGLSVSINAKAHATLESPLVQREIKTSQVKGSTCNTLSNSLVDMRDKFAILLTRLQIQHAANVTAANLSISNLNCSGEPSILKFNISAYLSTSIFKYCLLNDTVNILSSLETEVKILSTNDLFEFKSIDIQPILANVVKSKNWNIGNDVTLIFDLIGENNSSCTIQSIAKIQMSFSDVTQCLHPIETDPVDKLPPDSFQGCNGGEIRIRGGGVHSCANQAINITFKNDLLITALKVFGNRDDADYRILTQFKVEYFDEATNQFEPIGVKNPFVTRYQPRAKTYEILPLPRPVYTRQLAITPENNFVGSNGGLRLDVIQCEDGSGHDHLRWIRITKEPLCFNENKNEIYFVVQNNVDASHIKVVKKNGSFAKKDDGTGFYSPTLYVKLGTSSGTILDITYENDDGKKIVIGELFHNTRLYLKVNDTLRVDFAYTTLCVDIYALGTSLPRHRIGNVQSCITSKCQFWDILDIGSELDQITHRNDSKEIFYFDIKGHAIHAALNYYVKKSSNILLLSPNRTDVPRFRKNINGIIQDLTVTEAFIAPENNRLVLAGKDDRVERIESFMETPNTNYIISNDTIVITNKTMPFADGSLKCTNELYGYPIAIRTLEMWENVKNHLITNAFNNQYFIGLVWKNTDNSRINIAGFYWSVFNDVYNRESLLPLPDESGRGGNDCVVVDNFTLNYYDCGSSLPLICYVPPTDETLPNISANNEPGIKFNLPILSSGLQVIDGKNMGRGFQVSKNDQSKLHASLQTRSRLFEVLGPPFNGEISHFGITYDKNNHLLKLFVNGELYNQTNGTVIDGVIPYPARYSNFIVLSSYYDFSLNYLQTQFIDVSIWKNLLNDVTMTSYPTTDLVHTFDEDYIVQKTQSSEVRAGCLNSTHVSESLCIDATQELNTDVKPVASVMYASFPLDSSLCTSESSPICSDANVTVNPEQSDRHCFYRFGLSINRYSTFKTVFIKTTNVENFKGRTTLRVTALHIDSPLQNFTKCQSVAKSDLSVSATKVWTLNGLAAGSNMQSVDLSEIVQSTPNIQWDLKSTITFVVSVDTTVENSNEKIVIDLKNTTLEIYYTDRTPHYFHWFEPTVDYKLLSTGFYATFDNNDVTVEFWVYMSGSDCGLLQMWIYSEDDDGYKEKVQWFMVGNQGSNWQRQSFTTFLKYTQESPRTFAMMFHCKHYGIRCNAAIDNIGINTTRNSASGVYDNVAADQNIDYIGIELARLRLPAPLHMLLDRKQSWKQLNYLETRQTFTLLRTNDKFGFPFTAFQLRKYIDQAWSDLENADKLQNEFTILLHVSYLQSESENNGDIFRLCGSDCTDYFLAMQTNKTGVYLVAKIPSFTYVGRVMTELDIDDQWYFMGITYQDRVLNTYVNNQLVLTTTLQKNTFFSRLYLFTQPDRNGATFDGYISCFRIYNTVMKTNVMKASEVCSVHQDHRFHLTNCTNGVNVLYQKECECDNDVRYYVDSCENALPKTLFNKASFYLSFDKTVNESSEIGNMKLSTGGENYVSGPVNDMLCNFLDTLKSVGNVSAEYITNDSVVSFWLLMKNTSISVRSNKVVIFDNLILKTKEVNFNTISLTIRWNDFCNDIVLPIEAFVYINVYISSSSLISYINGNHSLATQSTKCPSETSDGADGIKYPTLTIGSMVCIDEFSVMSFKDMEWLKNLYTTVLRGEHSYGFDIHRQYVEVDILITTVDLPKNANKVLAVRYSEEAQLIIKLLSRMVKDHIDSVSAFADKNFGESNFVDLRFNSARMLESSTIAINATIFMRYITCKEHESLSDQNVFYDTRNFSLQLLNRTLRVSSAVLMASIEALNSTSIRIQIENLTDSEQLRYHLGFKVRLNSTYFEKEVFYNTGIRHFIVNGLIPYSWHDVTIWPVTHGGCGQGRRLSIHMPQAAPSGTVNEITRYNDTITEALFIHWQPVSPLQRHGVIVEYRITCNEMNVAYANVTWNTTVSGNVSSTSFSNLKNYTLYRIEITAATVIGYGPVANVTFRTAENVPSASPVILNGKSTTKTVFVLEFLPIPQINHEGILTGYRLSYQTAEKYLGCANTRSECKTSGNHTCFGSSISNCSIEGLQLLTNYYVCLSGFTAQGDGPESCAFVETGYFVDGNWNEWLEWGSCDKSCGKGLEARRRYCTNPEPSVGGLDCVGDSNETRICNNFTCPAFYLAAASFDCDVTCSKVNKSFQCGTRINTRNSIDVFKTAIDGNDITKEASVVCSEGGQEIYSKSFHPSYDDVMRTCNGFKDVPPQIDCKSTQGLSVNERRLCYCISSETEGYLEWAEWGVCSTKCGGGTKRRYRTCVTQSELCNKIEDTRDCNILPCKIDGNWGLWSLFSSCDRTCGYGRKQRVRSCTNPEPKFGGKDCEGGISVEYLSGCNSYPCPIHGVWSDWDFETLCSQPCGLGGRLRANRECNMPEPRFGGDYCIGSSTIETPCNENIPCKEVEINFKVKLPTEIWNFRMVYTDTKEFMNITNTFFTQLETSIENYPNVKSRLKSKRMVELERGSVVANFTLSYYEIPYAELVAVQDIIDRIGFVGSLPVEQLKVTTQNVPEELPEIIVKPSSPYSIYVSWEAMSLSLSSLNGVFYGYYLFYRLIPDNDNGSLPFWNTIGTTNTEIEIKYLKPYKTYGIRILIACIHGNGIATREKLVSTLSGKPTAAPRFNALNVKTINSTAIYIDWEKIPFLSVPGLLLGYKIVYRIYNGDLNSDDNGYTMLSNSDTVTQRFLYGMKPLTTYLIEVAGYTTAGAGPWASITMQTFPDAPSVCPPNIIYTDKVYSNTIEIQWDAIPKELLNCNLTGYTLEAKLVKRGPIDVLYDEAQVVRLDPFTFKYVLTDLRPYGEYNISLRGYGNEGDGPACTFIARTCKCPEYIFTNFYQSDGYVTVERTNKNNIDGLFPIFLTEILHKICSDCKSYAKPTIYYNRTFFGFPPEKLNEKDVRQSMNDVDHLNFPILARRFVEQMNGKYPFVIFASTKGSALIVLDSQRRVVGIVKILLAIASVWPLIGILVFVSSLFGWLIWFAEQRSIASDFILNRSISGFLNGLWTAVITMTTVGYGDFTPSTISSKIITVIWILIGLVSVSLFNATVSSNIYTKSILHNSRLYSTKTAVLNESFEHKLAILRNAEVKSNYVFEPNLTLSLLDAIADNTVEVGLLGVLVAAEYKDEIKKRGLRIDQVIDSDVGVGVALSGGLEAIEEDLKGFVLSSQTNIIKYLANKTRDFQPEPPADIELVVLPTSEAFLLLISFSIIYAILFVFGLLLTCIRHIRKKTRVEVSDKSLNSVEMLEDVSKIIKAFSDDFKANVRKVESRHSVELSTLAKLQRNYRRLLIRSGFNKEKINEGFEKHRKNALMKIVKTNKVGQL